MALIGDEDSRPGLIGYEERNRNEETKIYKV